MSEKKEELTQRGLKAMRKNKSPFPKYDCKNCGCKRYSPCGCQKKGGNHDATPQTDL